MKKNIYISYAWGDSTEERESREKIVNEIYDSLKENGFNIIRDKEDLAYKENIKEFEEHIGRGDYIILVISDKFLKSEHCMYEFLKIKEKGDIYSRIFPIILEDAKIYNEIDRIDYINFWDKKINDLNEKIKTITNSIGISSIIEKINQFHDIRRIFGDITDILLNMNTLTPAMHRENDFKILKTLLQSKESKNMKKYSSARQQNIDRANQDLMWEKYTSSDIQMTIQNKECAWILDWKEGKLVKNINLIYKPLKNFKQRFDDTIIPEIANEVKKWTQRFPQKSKKLHAEPWTWQVRLESIEYDHRTYKFNIITSEMKFLYYLAIQARLGTAELKELRDITFENALKGLELQKPLLLPSPLAIHIAIISSDGKALLRQRTSFTELYPSAWEAGIGEFMHGPATKYFPHFNESGNPDLFLYLKNAIAEELNYHDAKEDNFRIYGFALEYLTLCPKMLVVYESEVEMVELIKDAANADDSSPQLVLIDLNVKSICEAFKSHKYPTWGPTSKLALTLALLQSKSKIQDKRDILDEISKAML